MPGWQVEPTALAAESGSIKTQSFVLTDEEDPQIILTASSKSKIISILLTNVSGGTLPVTFSVTEGSAPFTTATIINKLRVHKRRYALQALVSGDTRVDEPMVGDSLSLTELVLETGDELKGYCPVASAVHVHVTYLEGVN